MFRLRSALWKCAVVSGLWAIGAPSFAAPAVPLCPAITDPSTVGKNGPSVAAGTDDWLFLLPQDFLVDYGKQPQGLKLLLQLRDALAERGTTLVLARLPPRGVAHGAKWAPGEGPAAQVDPAAAAEAYEKLLRWLRNAGLEVVDFQESAGDLPDSYYFSMDHHWTPDGARASARQLATRIGELAGTSPLPPVAFELKTSAPSPIRGNLVTKVEAACGKLPDVPDIAVPGLASVRSVEAVDEAALLGTEAPPQVVVVGDSQVNRGTRDAYYFVGQLRESLEADVANYGVDAGQLFPPMQGYLNSADFAEHPPRFLIWVSGAHLKVHNPVRLRQTTPAITADCSGASAPVSMTVGSELKAVEVSPVDGPTAVRIDPKNLELLRLTVQLTYADGHRENAQIHRSARVVENNPIWIQALDGHGPVVRVAAKTPKGPASEASVQVCTDKRPAQSP